MKKFFIALIMLAAAMTLRAAEPVKIIFDTDMGNDVDDVIARLNGITCGYKRTSCPDQLCRALEKIKADV